MKLKGNLVDLTAANEFMQGATFLLLAGILVLGGNDTSLGAIDTLTIFSAFTAFTGILSQSEYFIFFLAVALVCLVVIRPRMVKKPRNRNPKVKNDQPDTDFFE